MSKNQTKTLSKKFKYFDENFKEAFADVSVEFVPETDYATALSKLGNNNDVVLKAINGYLAEQAIEAKRPKGLPKAAVLNFLKPFRESSPYDKMVTLVKGQDGWRDQYKAQTEAILEACRQNDFIMTAIRSAAANSQSDDSGDDE